MKCRYCHSDKVSLENSLSPLQFFVACKECGATGPRGVNARIAQRKFMEINPDKPTRTMRRSGDVGKRSKVSSV